MAQKVLLMILDGWGEGNHTASDVIYTVKPEYISAMTEKYPHALLRTDGENVGLPNGQMGNSEVGHLNIGAGRVVYQDLVKINRACADNSILQNEEVVKAFEYAKANGKDRVSIVTKANVIKTTDGKFLRICEEMAKEYPEITTDEWFIDIMTAKLVDEKRRRDFKVFILPNLYGDIITDEAAEFQGGVGTAGSANIGKRYAMFEAIHGSAPRMVKEGRAKYADPCSMLRATVLLLSHIGYQEKADRLAAALDKCMFEEKKLTITGRDTGCTCNEFAEYVMQTLKEM